MGVEVFPPELLLELVGVLVVGWLLDEVGLLVLGVEFEELLDVGLEVLSPELLVGSWVSGVGSDVETSVEVSEVELSPCDD